MKLRLLFVKILSLIFLCIDEALQIGKRKVFFEFRKIFKICDELLFFVGQFFYGRTDVRKTHDIICTCMKYLHHFFKSANAWLMFSVAF